MPVWMQIKFYFFIFSAAYVCINSGAEVRPQRVVLSLSKTLLSGGKIAAGSQTAAKRLLPAFEKPHPKGRGVAQYGSKESD